MDIFYTAYLHATQKIMFDFYTRSIHLKVVLGSVLDPHFKEIIIEISVKISPRGQGVKTSAFRSKLSSKLPFLMKLSSFQYSFGRMIMEHHLLYPRILPQRTHHFISILADNEKKIINIISFDLFILTKM